MGTGVTLSLYSMAVSCVLQWLHSTGCLGIEVTLTYLHPESFIHHGQFLLFLTISQRMAPHSPFCMATQRGGRHPRQLHGRLVKFNIVEGLQPAARYRLWGRAMETIKLGAIHKRCRTPLRFKQASETAMFSLEAVNGDVILSAAIHRGQQEGELWGRGRPRFMGTQQRDLQQRVQAVELALSHQHTQAERLTVFLVVTSCLRLAGMVERMGQNRLLHALVSQAVGGHKGPWCTAQGTGLTGPLPFGCLRSNKDTVTLH